MTINVGSAVDLRKIIPAGGVPGLSESFYDQSGPPTAGPLAALSPVILVEPRDGYMWKEIDDSRATNATADGDLVGQFRDLFTPALYHTVAALGERPTLRISGAIRWLEGPFVLPFAGSLVSGLTAAECLAAVRGVNGNGLWQWGSGAGNWYPLSPGGDIYEDFASATRWNWTPAVNPAADRVYGVRKPAGGLADGALDGGPPSANNNGTLGWAATPKVGTGGPGTTPFSGRLYGLALFGSVLAAPDRASAITYLASLQGRVL